MIEKEIWSRMTEEKFNESVKVFKEKYGEPKFKKRIAVQITDYNRTDLDTRIRITNGYAEIMQKIGSWTGESQEEVDVKLPTESENILNTYKVLRNMLQSDNVETSIIQLENYVFDTEKFELKFTHQFGKVHVYNFEIEVKDLNLEPKQIAAELGLELDIPENTPEFWKNWNNTVNLYAKDLSDSELLEIFKSYL